MNHRFKINTKLAMKIMPMMQAIEEKEGEPYCPCKPNEHSKNTICPCFDLVYNDHCCCNLFVLKDKYKNG